MERTMKRKVLLALFVVATVSLSIGIYLALDRDALGSGTTGLLTTAAKSLLAAVAILAWLGVSEQTRSLLFRAFGRALTTDSGVIVTSLAALAAGGLLIVAAVRMEERTFSCDPSTAIIILPDGSALQGACGGHPVYLPHGVTAVDALAAGFERQTVPVSPEKVVSVALFRPTRPEWAGRWTEASQSVSAAECTEQVGAAPVAEGWTRGERRRALIVARDEAVLNEGVALRVMVNDASWGRVGTRFVSYGNNHVLAACFERDGDTPHDSRLILTADCRAMSCAGFPANSRCFDLALYACWIDGAKGGGIREFLSNGTISFSIVTGKHDTVRDIIIEKGDY